MSALPRISEPPSQKENYRDELNFAEFPLASLATTLPKDQKTLEFTDEIFDKSLNKRVQRKLTITASDKYGLPTAMDEEVILGLIQLTSRTDFDQRRVFFTRYELLKLLNWPDRSRNYHRLEESLNRWLGVTLYYDKAWWSKEEQSWVSEGFHILDHVQIFDQERQRRSAKKGTEDAGKSSFVWNEVVYNSFKAGYIKQIDFEFYKGLKSAISKRLYRFLDKRFYRGQRLDFDLRTFSCEHIGLSKNYHTGELKRVLTPAIRELEQRGYIDSMPVEERFIRQARGEWAIVFTRNRATRIEKAINNPLVEALVARGLSEASAKKLVGQREARTIEEKIALVDWLCSRKDYRVQKNPAGFLFKAIVEDFSLPEDYQKTLNTKKPTTSKIMQDVRVTPAPISSRSRDGIDEYWNSLGAEEQQRLESELVKAANPFLKQQYVEGKKGRGLLFKTIRQAIIDDYVRSVLAKSPAH